MATEKRLIDANALMAAFREYMVKHHDRIKCVSEENCIVCENGCLWRKVVSETPTVDAVEVVHGRWEKPSKHGFSKIMDKLGGVCSACSEWNDNETNYCPNCGAKMDGDGNG